MKLLFTLLIFTLLCLETCFSQEPDFHKETGVIEMSKTLKSFHFRMSSHSQVIDIWVEKDGRVKGSVTNWCREHITRNRKADEVEYLRIYSEKHKLSEIQAKTCLILIDTSDLMKMPDGKDIEGWKLFSDGNSYYVEVKDSLGYTRKYYNNPAMQDALVEGPVISSIISQLLEITEAKSMYRAFANNVPFPEYSNGSMFSFIVPTSKEKLRMYKRGRREYLKKQKANF